MIARTWHGIVPQCKKENYLEYLKKTGLSDYRKSEGNLGIQVLRKDVEQVTHFFLITFWDSVKSIKKFAGEEYTRARYYPDDEAYLLELEPFVDHFEVLDIVGRNPVFDTAEYVRKGNGQLGYAAWSK